MLHHPAWESELQDAFPEVVCGFSVLPAEIGDCQFNVEIPNVRDSGTGADYLRTFAKKEAFKNLRGIKALPAGAGLITSEIDIGQTHTEREGAARPLLDSFSQKLAGSPEKRMQDHV
jgi:hypothetical protein